MKQKKYFNRVKICIALLLFILIQTPLLAQTKGVIIDKYSHQPISFVSIYAKNAGKVLGTMSEENGRFELNFPSQMLYFSHINYSKIELVTKNISDTIFLVPKGILLNEVLVNIQKPKWIPRILNNIVKWRFVNYQKSEQQFGYNYETYCLGDTSGYAFRSKGDLLVPPLTKNGNYRIHATDNTIRYKDKTAGPDFSNLKRMLYSDFIKDFNAKFIGNYSFIENTSFENNEKNLVQLMFKSKKYQDDKGYIVVDTLNNVILEFERTSGTDFNVKTQTTSILRNAFNSYMSLKYINWNTVFRAKYSKIGNCYQLIECKYKLYLNSVIKNKKVNQTNFNSYEAQLFINNNIDSKNTTWTSIPRPWYMIAIYTKKMRLEEELLNKVPLKFEDF